MSADSNIELLQLFLPTLVKDQIQRAAEIQGYSLSDFFVAAALEHAQLILEQHMLLKLCQEDSMALAAAFLKEPKPNAKAIAAAKHHKKMMGQT